jgi:GNAT superfamily N-acetyltransferase
MEDFIARKAKPTEAGAISDLAFRSKAHWGYDAGFMNKCRDDLTITPEDCSTGLVVVATTTNGELAGFYKLTGKAPKGRLSDLFVDPSQIGKGLGKILLNEAKKHAVNLGFEELEIHSDPHAEDFYLHMGAERVGEIPSSSIPGRSLPLLVLKV